MKKIVVSCIVLLFMFLMMTVSIHATDMLYDQEGKRCSRHMNWAYYYKQQSRLRRKGCCSRVCTKCGRRGCIHSRRRRKTIAAAPTAVGIGNNRRLYQRPQVMNGQASGEGFAETAEGFQSRSTKW